MNLLALVVLLQAVVLIGILVLLFRRRSPAVDPRLAELPGQLTRLDTRAETLDAALRSGLADIRREGSDNFSALRGEITASISTLGATLHKGLADFRTDNAASAASLSKSIEQQFDTIAQKLAAFISEANRSQIEARESSDAALRSGLADIRREGSENFSALRGEITASISTLGATLQKALADFRTDNAASATTLSKSVEQQFDNIAQKLAAFISEANRSQIEAREASNRKLNELGAANTANLEKIRTTVEERLDRLNDTNAAKLEQMRQTVDEKLQTTLHTRLTESFGQVTDQLNKVHTGLGEMTKLSEGVDGLSRIFTNVKSRGGFAEVQLGMLLEQMLAPSQFVRNARVKTGSQEVVEFAVRFPGHNGETLLPIDAKFPREDWERLEAAYENGSAEERHSAGKAFEAAIRTEGKRICEKYIQPPVTTPHAVMFLPTEGLYAEVMRREGLQAEVQSKCRVTIAGPSSLSAILTSFQMGFALIAFQKKGDEVWKVLESAKGEFDKFGNLMSKMETQVGTVQNTIQLLNTRTRAINRTLREVTNEAAGPPAALDFDAIAPLLAAAAHED